MSMRYVAILWILVFKLLILRHVHCDSEFAAALSLKFSDFSKFRKDSIRSIFALFSNENRESNKLIPVFKEAAKLYSYEKDIAHVLFIIVSVESTDELEAYNITRVPVLKLFKKEAHTELVFDYEGSLSSEKSMSDFIRRKLKEVSFLAKEITNIKQNTKAIPAGKAVLYFFGEKSSPQYETFLEVARKYPGGCLYLHTSAKEIFDYYHIQTPYACLMFNPFILAKFVEELGKPISYNGNWTADNLLDFTKAYSTRSLLRFEIGTYSMLHREKKKVLILVVDGHKNEKIEEVFIKTRDVLGSKITLGILDINTRAAQEFVDQTSITNADTPSLWLCDLKPRQVLRYRYSGELSETNIVNFYFAWKNQLTKPLWKSGPLPVNDPNSLVKKMVSSNFFENIDHTKDVLVLMKSEKCGYCKKFLQIYEKLAETMKNIPTLVFAMVDSLENEIEGLIVESVPSLFIFPASSKEQKAHLVQQGLEENISVLLEKINELATHKFDKKKEEL